MGINRGVLAVAEAPMVQSPQLHLATTYLWLWEIIPCSAASSTDTDSDKLLSCFFGQQEIRAAGPEQAGRFLFGVVSLWVEVVYFACGNKILHPQPPPC